MELIEYDELIPAKAGYMVIPSNQLPELIRNKLKQSVAHLMSEAVIDFFEKIKIQHNDRKRLIVVYGGRCNLLIEFPSIR
ncbi:hypothetical protein D3C72_2230650 [compost metagenome]